jgi:hypothetical protein
LKNTRNDVYAHNDVYAFNDVYANYDVCVYTDAYGNNEVKYLFDKRQKSNPLPCELFSVEIDFEIFRIKVDDRRLGIDHQLGPRIWDMRSETNDSYIMLRKYDIWHKPFKPDVFTTKAESGNILRLEKPQNVTKFS